MRLLFLFCSLNLAFECLSQLPFAQAIQAPLALNPSMAGNKNKNRLSLAYNQGTQKESKAHNAYVSYDTFWKKAGAGVGFYYDRQTYSSSKVPSTWRKEVPLPHVPLNQFRQQTSHSFGAAIAPKYNVMDKVYFHEIKYSISPSLYLGYTDGTQQRTDHFRYSFEQKCTCLDPSGKLKLDSASFTQSTIRERLFTVGLGVMFTSDNLLLFVRLQHETGMYKEDFALSNYQSSTSQLSILNTRLNQTLYALQGVVGTGISFPKKQNAKLYATPFAAIGFRRHLNLGSKTEISDDKVYSENLSQKSVNQLVFSHMSFNIRYQYVIAGLAYTHTMLSDAYGVSLGFQNTWSKTLVTVNFLGDFAFGEVGTGVWF